MSYVNPSYRSPVMSIANETQKAPNYMMGKKEKKMPLLPGKKNIGHNISEMEEAGHPKAQAIAASLNEARKSGAHISKAKSHINKDHSPKRHKEHR